MDLFLLFFLSFFASECLVKNTVCTLRGPGVEVKTCVGAKVLRWLHPNQRLFSGVSGSPVLANTSLTFFFFFAHFFVFVVICIVPGPFLDLFFFPQNARLVSTVCPFYKIVQNH